MGDHRSYSQAQSQVRRGSSIKGDVNLTLWARNSPEPSMGVASDEATRPVNTLNLGEEDFLDIKPRPVKKRVNRSAMSDTALETNIGKRHSPVPAVATRSSDFHMLPPPNRIFTVSSASSSSMPDERLRVLHYDKHIEFGASSPFGDKERHLPVPLLHSDHLSGPNPLNPLEELFNRIKSTVVTKNAESVLASETTAAAAGPRGRRKATRASATPSPTQTTTKFDSFVHVADALAVMPAGSLASATFTEPLQPGIMMSAPTRTRGLVSSNGTTLMFIPDQEKSAFIVDRAALRGIEFHSFSSRCKVVPSLFNDNL